MNLNKYLPMTETTYYILLALSSRLHGYGIMQRVLELSGGTVEIAPGTMYGALDNLKKQKLIDLVDEDAGNRRKVYALSDLGRQVLSLEYARLRRLVEVSSLVLETQEHAS